MLKQEIHILPTPSTPELIISPKGTVKIKGRALGLSNCKFPDQIVSGFEAYLSNPPDKTDVTIAFEYLNSFSTYILISFLIKLTRAVSPPKSLFIQWFYERDDDDMLELGKYISQRYHLPIDFKVTDDITGL